MNPPIRALIRRRNRLRRTIQRNRQEWHQACQEVNDAITEAKTNSWRDFLADAVSSSDPTKTWKVIKSLNGTPDSSSPNEAIIHKGRTIIDQKQKANIFVKHYARVSNLSLSATDRDLVRQFKKRMDQPSDADVSCSPLLMSELKAAISRIKKKGAAGPDNIPPTFLKALGTKALTELLSIFNSSFDLAACPRIWRIATIIPILKAGKLVREVASYHPISLTSCVV